MRDADPNFAPWKADLSLRFSYEIHRTVLAEKRFSGPLVVQKPLYPEGDAVCHAIVVHPPAGIVGGDQLSLRISGGPKSAVLLTTPGASKWYRSAGRAIASQSFRFDVEGSLEWLPQETIVFDGAQADVACNVNLGADATYIGWEILCLGRTGSGERFNNGRIELRNKICRDGQPVWRERGTIDANGRLMHAPAGLGGKSVCATLIAAAPRIDRSVLAACREIAGVAVTLLPGLLIARHLGDSSESAKQRFIELWRILRPAIHGRIAHEPRIWST